MKFLENLTKKTSIFQRTIGLNINQFDLLTDRFAPHWEKAEEQRKLKADRKRKIGAGHPYKFESLKEKLLIVLLYYKLYLTQEFLGVLVDLDQANVSRLLQKMLLLIEKAADPELVSYLDKIKTEHISAEKTKDWAAFFARNPELKDVSIDATEQSCHRSQNDEEQKKHYSGKKKKHTLKTQVSVASTGRIMDVSRTYPGSVHDKKIIDTEQTIEKFPLKTCLRFDSGYQGVKEHNKLHYIVLPFKKPKNKELSDLAKELNRANSKRRVIAEHAISRLKKFRICSNLYRGALKSYNQTFRNVVSILNFKLANPSVIR
jgi:hypothetical protein